jgi:hypothetical protein
VETSAITVVLLPVADSWRLATRKADSSQKNRSREFLEVASQGRPSISARASGSAASSSASRSRNSPARPAYPFSSSRNMKRQKTRFRRAGSTNSPGRSASLSIGSSMGYPLSPPGRTNWWSRTTTCTAAKPRRWPKLRPGPFPDNTVSPPCDPATHPLNDSHGAKRALSARSPMSTITSMIATTWSMAFSSRP